MELKPIKEVKKISESKKFNLMKNILLASALDVNPRDLANLVQNMQPKFSITPIYTLCRFVLNVTFITTSIFLLLLIKNKIKIKKSINENEEKINRIKKYIKIDLSLFTISLVIMIISIGIIFYVNLTC